MHRCALAKELRGQQINRHGVVRASAAFQEKRPEAHVECSFRDSEVNHYHCSWPSKWPKGIREKGTHDVKMPLVVPGPCVLSQPKPVTLSTCQAVLWTLLVGTRHPRNLQARPRTPHLPAALHACFSQCLFMIMLIPAW